MLLPLAVAVTPDGADGGVVSAPAGVVMTKVVEYALRLPAASIALTA